jgi:hypothetical protein
MYLWFDYYFSFWLFAAYLFYEFKLINFNPKIGLIIALFENLIVFLLMIYYKNSLLYIFLLCIGVLLFKLIPLWRLRNTSYRWVDVYSMFVLFLIYIVWLVINKFDFRKYPIDSYNNLKHNKPTTPFANDVSEIIKLISK